MKFCKASNCENPVFGKGYCKQHTYLREDFDSRSITQRGLDKHKKQQQNAKEKNSIRSLHTDEMEGMDSRNSLIQDLDRYCSLYVRIRDAGVHGVVFCYTCGVRKHWTLMHCSHFINRANMGLRFDVRNNLRSCCIDCNVLRNGNLVVYAANLEKEQAGLPEMLQEQSRQVEKIGNDELSQLLIDIRAKYNIIKTKIINPPKN